jgi:hypothetical protein
MCAEHSIAVWHRSNCHFNCIQLLWVVWRDSDNKLMLQARHIANFTVEEFNSQNREILDYNSLSYYVKHSENKFMIVEIFIQAIKTLKWHTLTHTYTIMVFWLDIYVVLMTTQYWWSHCWDQYFLLWSISESYLRPYKSIMVLTFKSDLPFNICSNVSTF